MTAEQRQMFQDTLLEDEAASRRNSPRCKRLAQDAGQAQGQHPVDPAARRCPIICAAWSTTTSPKTPPARRRTAAQPMTRVGEDVSERLDIVPAEFFVHRHIYGKWACRCCQRQGIERLVQEPADPQIIDGGIPASGLVAHTLISRFVDHLPYYRQETINARSGVHTPRSTLAAWAGVPARRCSHCTRCTSASC
jgi:transposase